MQGGIAAIVGMFAVSMWDIAQNHGTLSRAVLESVMHFVHSLGAL